MTGFCNTLALYNLVIYPCSDMISSTTIISTPIDLALKQFHNLEAFVYPKMNTMWHSDIFGAHFKELMIDPFQEIRVLFRAGVELVSALLVLPRYNSCDE